MPKQEDPYRVWHPWSLMPALLRDERPLIVRAEGCSFFTADGRRLLDASSGLWNAVVGYGRQEVIEAISGQLSELTFLSNIGRRSTVANRLAGRLLAHAPAGLGHVGFYTTGTAANEGALLLIRQYFKLVGQPQRTRIVSVEGAYHGCSLLCAAVAGDPDDLPWLEPTPDEVDHIPAPRDEPEARRSLAALERILAAPEVPAHAAFIFEPILGMGGIVIPPEGWMRSAVEICRRHGVKVIADEVVTGLGRAGCWFLSAAASPDVIVVGKGLGGGYVPVAAALLAYELTQPYLRDEEPVDFKYGSTMDGFPAGCAAALAVLDLIEGQNLVERSARLGEAILPRLQKLAGRGIVGGVRGRGLMIGIDLVEPKTGEPMQVDWAVRVTGALADAGVFILRSGSTLTLLPALTISDDELGEIVAQLSRVLSDPPSAPIGRVGRRIVSLFRPEKK